MVREKNNNERKLPLEISSSTRWKVNNEIARLNKSEVIIIDSPPHMGTEETVKLVVLIMSRDYMY